MALRSPEEANHAPLIYLLHHRSAQRSDVKREPRQNAETKTAETETKTAETEFQGDGMDRCPPHLASIRRRQGGVETQEIIPVETGFSTA
jgi:hypothetical protein